MELFIGETRYVCIGMDGWRPARPAPTDRTPTPARAPTRPAPRPLLSRRLRPTILTVNRLMCITLIHPQPQGGLQTGVDLRLPGVSIIGYCVLA